MVRVGSYELEFVGARKESYKKNSRNPVVESGSLEDDQKRRDFTVNALAFALNPKEFGTLIDPFDGLEDLDKKVLKTPLTAAQTFSDDPLRMLRAVRFAAQLDFTIYPTTMKSIRNMAERIKILSQERIIEEIHKILLTQKPSKGFLLLDKLDLLEHILPELCALKGIEEVEGQRHKDNFITLLKSLTTFAKPPTTSGCDGLLYFMILEKHLPKSLIKKWVGRSTAMNL